MIPLAAPTAKVVKEVMDTRTQKLEEEHNQLLRELNEKLEKQTSFWGNVQIGVVRGVATAIGATIVAAIAFSVFSSAINTVDDVPIIRDIIDEANVQNAIEAR